MSLQQIPSVPPPAGPHDFASVLSPSLLDRKSHRTAYSANHPGRIPYTSGFLHSATMVDLLPSTTYYYSCGDEALGMSSVRSFVTPPKVGGEQAVTFGILGDLGQTEDSECVQYSTVQYGAVVCRQCSRVRVKGQEQDRRAVKD